MLQSPASRYHILALHNQNNHVLHNMNFDPYQTAPGPLRSMYIKQKEASSVNAMSDTCACGCRGARTCLMCERDKGILARNEDMSAYSLYQCHNCGKIGPIEDCEEDPAERPLYVCREPCRPAAVLCSHHTELGIPFDTFEGAFEGVTACSQRFLVSARRSQHCVCHRQRALGQLSVRTHTVKKKCV